MAVGEEDGGRVAVPVPGMLAGGILETVDLLRGQIFTLPQIGGRRGVTVRFTRVEGSRRVLGIFTGNAPYGKVTFRIMCFLRKDIKRSKGGSLVPTWAIG